MEPSDEHDRLAESVATPSMSELGRGNPSSIPREHRLRWVTARAAGEVLEALDEDPELEPRDRIAIYGAVRYLQDVVDHAKGVT